MFKAIKLAIFSIVYLLMRSEYITILNDKKTFAYCSRTTITVDVSIVT